jgi:hypothetical protein
MTNPLDTLAEQIIDLDLDDEITSRDDLLLFLRNNSLPIDDPRTSMILAMSDELDYLEKNADPDLADEIHDANHDELAILIADKLLARL